MTSKFKIFLKSDIEHGEVKLPKRLLSFLQNKDYFSISKIKNGTRTEWHAIRIQNHEENQKDCKLPIIMQEKIDGKTKWYVETPMRSYESLLEVNKEYDALEVRYNQLMKNIEEDKRPENHKRSCTPTEKARKEGWKPTSDKPLDGHYPST
jgi:expansin (peptidoglycan-binding protein)